LCESESGGKGRPRKEWHMGENLIALAAVVLTCGLPVAALYTYYRVRKLRTEERLAALARGTEIPMEPELSQFARSRRAGILLVSGGLGFMIMFAVIARVVGEPETLVASAVGILPLAVGIGYFVDAALIHRDLKPT
jgi:hypothetical protein